MLNSRWTVWVAALLLPPVGLVLLWLRKAPLLLKCVGSVAILAWTGVWMLKLGLVQMQRDGSGFPLFSWKSAEAHYSELEKSRAKQRAATPVTKPEPVTTAEPPTAPVAKPAPEPPTNTATVAAKQESGYWTSYRGPQRDGHYRQGPILTQWPEVGLKMLWQQPIGGGYASVVVAGRKVFTIEQRRKQEVVAAYDVETGREIWTNAWDADFQESMGGPGPRATPTWHDGKLYALGATGEFRCLDATTGKVIWRKNILEENGAENLPWAMSGSPLVVDDKVIVLPGGTAGKSVVAYNRNTGSVVWTSLNDRGSYTSPMLADLAGKRQILFVTADRAVGIEPGHGKLLWEFPWKTEYDINSAQPLALEPNRVFLSSGYGHGAAVIELEPAGEGFQARQIWANNRMKNKFSSSVLHNGYIYGLDEAILACIDPKTGELKWKGGRYGYGQVLLASGHLIVTTESGEVVLLKATPEEHQEIARFPAVDGKTWNNPAISDGNLFVRNTTDLACFRIAP